MPVAQISTIEDQAIRDMMETIVYLIVGNDAEGSKTSRPRSLIDIFKLIEEHQNDMPQWVMEKICSPHLNEQLHECENAWADICSLNEQLRQFYLQGKQPHSGYLKPTIERMF